MRLQQILVAHSLRSIRDIIKRFILSEFSNAAISDAADEAAVIAQFKRQTFDLILADADLLFKNNPSLYQQIHDLAQKNRIPLIAVTVTEVVDQINARLSKDLEQCLVLPFNARELIKMIRLLCDPRSWRTHDRFNIPDARVMLKTGSAEIETRLINIDMGGVLCELNYDQQPLNLLSKIYIDLKLPPPYDPITIAPIKSRLSRMNVISWHENEHADYLRLTFIFEPLPEPAEKALQRFIAQVRLNQQQSLAQMV